MSLSVDVVWRVLNTQDLWRLRSPPALPISNANAEQSIANLLSGTWYDSAYGRLCVCDTKSPDCDADGRKLLARIAKARKFGPMVDEPDYVAWLSDGMPMWTTYFAVFKLSSCVFWVDEHIMGRKGGPASEVDKSEEINMSHAVSQTLGDVERCELKQHSGRLRTRLGRGA